jgi:hypothetical protein
MSRSTDIEATPRFAAGWAALVYALATFSLAYPAFAGLFLVNPRSDQYIAGYAFREFAAQSLRSGQGFPQWNPYLFGGLPYIAAMHGDIFYPTFLLRMLVPTDVAMTWGFIIHLFLAGFFTFAFLRAWGVGFYGSLIGGLAYMLSGPIAAYASPGHDGKLFVSTLLPLALWMLVRLIRDGRRWAFGVFALTVGLAVLSPHPQLLQYLLLTSGAFALYIAFAAHDWAGKGEKLARDVALRRLGLALSAVILGVLMGAVQYLPVREYVPWSPRAAGMGWEHATSYSFPLEELFNTIVPQFSGMLDNYWGRNGIHLHSEYPGVVVLVLAGAGMFASAFRRSFRWFWIGVFVVSLLWALGGSTPFFRIVYAIVPGTKFFRAPSTMMFVSMFSLAVLAALGTDRVLNAASSIPKRFVWIWAGAIVFVCVILVAGLPGVIAEGIAAQKSAAGYPTASVARVTEMASANQPNVIVGVVRSIVFTLFVLGVIWGMSAGQMARRQTAWALAVLVAADLWSVEHNYWIFSAPAKKLFASDPAIDAIRASREVGRAFAWDPLHIAVERDPAFGVNGTGDGDGLMVHRVRSVTGYHGNELGRYQQVLASQNPLTPQFWRHENVHFLYTTIPDSVMPQAMAQLRWPSAPTKLVGPVRNAAGSVVYLYRVPGDNPAAWVAAAMVKGTDDQALATVLDSRFEPGRAAIIDTAANVPVTNLTTVPPAAGVKANVTEYVPRRINVQLDAPVHAGAALVVSENYFPGWQASVSGRRATVVRANYNLIGVVLPAGAREVQLTFTDSAYESGKTITLVALALALAAIAAGVFLDRRRLAPAV